MNTQGLDRILSTLSSQEPRVKEYFLSLVVDLPDQSLVCSYLNAAAKACGESDPKFAIECIRFSIRANQSSEESYKIAEAIFLALNLDGRASLISAAAKKLRHVPPPSAPDVDFESEAPGVSKAETIGDSGVSGEEPPEPYIPLKAVSGDDGENVSQTHRHQPK